MGQKVDMVQFISLGNFTINLTEVAFIEWDGLEAEVYMKGGQVIPVKHEDDTRKLIALTSEEDSKWS